MTDKKQYLTKSDLVLFRQMVKTYIDIHPHLNVKPNGDYIRELYDLIGRIYNTMEIVGEIGK